MKERRLTKGPVDPNYEDAGLFKKPLVRIPVQLVPQVQRNQRQDVLVPAFAGSAKEVTVVFAGRRAKHAQSVIRHLSMLSGKARHDGLDGSAGFDLEQRKYRLDVMIDGAWRVRFARDDEGWENRNYQLIAAQWTLIGRGVTPEFKGVLPFQ